MKDVPELAEIGYPVAEISPAGTLVITKPRGTGGMVDRRTVTEQILYEVHDPAAYFTPDVTLDITAVELTDDGRDRVRVAGARGHRRPDRLKATVFVESGILGEAEISYAGPNALARARLAADIITARMRHRAPDLLLRIDAIGRDSTFGALTPDCSNDAPPPSEIRLRFAAQGADRNHRQAGTPVRQHDGV